MPSKQTIRKAGRFRFGKGRETPLKPFKACDTCTGAGTLVDFTVKPPEAVMCMECKGTGRAK